jgi:hypothetical protein
MKNVFAPFSTIALALLSVTAHASDVKCGDSVTIPSELLNDLDEVSCIGLDREIGLAVVSGTSASGLTFKTIELDRNGRARKVVAAVSPEATEEKTTPYYAFERNCGLALITSRVVDRDEVLLIFDNLTVIRWNWRNPNSRIVALASDYDPKAFYLCYGIQEGIDTYAELIDFDRAAGKMTVRGIHRGSVTVRF